MTPFDRGRIAALQEEGKTQTAIAEAIGCAKSTISRELKRGTVTQMKTGRATFEAYFPETGQLKYEENRQACGAKLKLDDAIGFIQYAETKILDDHWSPDAVCGSATFHEQFEGKRVCTKTLYNYIELGYIGVKNIDLPMKVRLNTKKRRIRVNKRVLGRSIEERPEAVEDRTEFGHWEIDTVIGKKSQDEALMTLTERKTRQEIIIRIDDKGSDSITKALELVRNKFDANFAQVFKTITSDNGSEFAELAASLEKDKTAVFFTHPYTSCERGKFMALSQIELFNTFASSTA
uniref:IS30 family transposase n=1 Tax=Planococcus antarcticus TaxID=161360 RepID=UPI000A7E9DAE|nr:IS30 family transposase [Planococcus antarcticus]